MERGYGQCRRRPRRDEGGEQMSTPNTPTETHLELAKNALFARDASGRLMTAQMVAQLLADSEARAVEAAVAAIIEKNAPEIAKANAELARLRALFPAICSALGNGAFCTPDVSIGFLESVPNEVASVVARLRAELSAVQAQHLHEIDELAAQAKIMNALRAELATCKDASEALVYSFRAENDRLIDENVKLTARAEKAGAALAEVESQTAATSLKMQQRNADLRAEKAEKLWKEFITLMDITEESDSGNAFNPNKISSCRAMDGKRLNEILIEARQIVF